MHQRWSHLLFLHWSWDAAEVQRTLPAGLTVDTFEGRAWVAITPFFMEGVRPMLFPPMPGLSNFLECNVRTYVFDAQRRPGVWFYSLDANNWFAVKVARTLFNLPYQHAEMSAEVTPTGTVDYRVRRAGTGPENHFRYTACQENGQEASAGSLDFFLTERYRLFAQSDEGHLYSGRVAHAPYRLGSTDVPVWSDGLLRLAGFDPAGRPPDHVCAAAPVDVDVFSPERVEEPASVSATEVLGEQVLPVVVGRSPVA